jgi:signal transduction histidine kinase/CheY-like chemotaxis protein
MDDPLLQLMSRGVFILVFCLTLLDFIRKRDLQRLEVAAVFGTLGLVTVLQSFTDVTSIQAPDWLQTAAVFAILAQPYLLVRVLAQFRPVPRLQRTVALVAMIVSCALYLPFGAALPIWGTLAIVAAFAYVEGYATLSFIRSALVHRGVSQQRIIAVALGSGSLAAIFVLAGIDASVPVTHIVLKPLMDLLGLASAVAYYMGMAPPRWLVRVWQGGEVRRFLLGLTGLSGNQRMASILEYLGPAAARATGGKAAIIGLAQNETHTVLDLHTDPAAAKVLEVLKISTLDVDRSPALDSVWRTRTGVALGSADDWGWELRQIGEALAVHGALIAPLVAGDRMYGVFIAFITRASLFVADDLAVLGVLADQAALAIEGRMLMEERARERSTLAAVMSSMHEGLLVMDDDLVIRYCNDRTTELLGIEPQTLIGKSLIEAFQPLRPRLVAAEAVNAEWNRALRNVESRPTLDYELTAPSRSLHAEVFPVVDASTAKRGTGLVLRDVTAERDLVRTKDELVSVVSHELRTPLASVVGFAELLRTRELGEAQRQQFLTVILEEGRRLTALINDFLDLQRMESGRQDINPRRIALGDVLQQSVQAAGADPARPIELDLPPDLRPVRADEDRVRQVMANLLSNARKYSPGGGTVRVSAREADGQVTISVQDDGLGLPPEALPRLFEKFFRVDNTDRRSITGTGLGLAICRKIIDAHGGRIWAESDGLGRGSRFSFSLPVADARNTSGDVLIVEDVAGFSRLLEAELANRGISVVWVPSAEEALEQLEIEIPKAILLDLLLPGMQGEAFLQKLRQKYAWNLPVLVVTVKDLSQTERDALNQLKLLGILRKEPAVGATAADILETAVRQRADKGSQRGKAA